MHRKYIILGVARALPGQSQSEQACSASQGRADSAEASSTPSRASESSRDDSETGPDFSVRFMCEIDSEIVGHLI